MFLPSISLALTNFSIRFPKTYPTLACPIFTIQQPIVGLKPHDLTKLSNAVHAEAQSSKGSEIVFQVSFLVG